MTKTDEGMWAVSLFEEDHNHMCETPQKCHLFPSHRRVNGNQGAMIEKMNEAGIRKNLMMHYLLRKLKEDAMLDSQKGI